MTTTSNTTTSGDQPTNRPPPHRLVRLQQWISNQEADALLVTGAINVAYLTGYWRYYNLPAAALLERNGERTLLVTRDEVPVAQQGTDIPHILPWTTRGFGLDLDLLGLLARAVAKLEPIREARRVAIADGLGIGARLSDSVSAALLPAGDTLARFRCIKDPDELAGMRTCYELAWDAIDAIRAALPEAPSEIEMFSLAQSSAQIAHGEPIEFSADILCGTHTADDGPRRIAGTQRVAPGDSVTADVRVGCGGFWSDICETVVSDNDRIAGARETLLQILERAATLLRPRSTGADIYRHVADAIADHFPDGAFVHHAGHAVGREPIETPRLMPDDHTEFEPGMVFSIEPGVYYEGRWGARVEKTYVVGPDGGTELSAITTNEARPTQPPAEAPRT